MDCIATKLAFAGQCSMSCGKSITSEVQWGQDVWSTQSILKWTIKSFAWKETIEKGNGAVIFLVKRSSMNITYDFQSINLSEKLQTEI